jgi:DNA-binding transcriptional LysR family regulator
LRAKATALLVWKRCGNWWLQGVGVTLIPQLAVPASAVEGEVQYIPFSNSGADQPMRSLGLCWRATSTRAELLQQVAEMLRECMAQR